MFSSYLEFSILNNKKLEILIINRFFFFCYLSLTSAGLKFEPLSRYNCNFFRVILMFRQANGMAIIKYLYFKQIWSDVCRSILLFQIGLYSPNCFVPLNQNHEHNHCDTENTIARLVTLLFWC